MNKLLIITAGLLIGLVVFTKCNKTEEQKRADQLFGTMKSGTYQDYLGAIEEFSEWGSPAVPSLIKGLDSRDVFVRCGSAEALGKIKDPSAVRPLTEALGDRERFDVYEGVTLVYSENVTCAAAKALSRIGDEAAVEPLIRLLTDRDMDFRGCAAEALGAIGDERAIGPLIERLRDRSVTIQEIARMALNDITSKYLGDKYEHWKAWYDKEYGGS